MLLLAPLARAARRSGGTLRARVEQVLARMGPGEFFGEMSLLDQSPRSATVQSEIDCLLLSLDRQNLRQLVEMSPRAAAAFYRAMLGVFIQRLRESGDQIAEVLTIHTDLDDAARRKRVLEVMEAVRLPEPERLIDVYPHQLSGGQRQRIMIAMALALEPALLIADEPTTALDVTTQAQILRLIVELQKRHGMGVLFITHDFGVVAEIAHRVAVLREGRLVELGAKLEVLQRPRHEYTRMLIRAVPTLQPHGRAVSAAAPLVLETKSLSKTYVDRGWLGARREVRAASEVNLEVRKGQTLGIVGESGSGKSTVARCIVRLIEPSSGEIRLGDADLARMRPRALRPLRRRVQIVFQDPYRSLNPRRSVGEAIIEGPLNYGVPRPAALERARRLLELVRMDPAVLDRYPHQFSGGQRQRICIARALAMEPELLVADEPVSALDVSVQAQVLELLAEIRDLLASRR